ncbi:phosphatidate cytidylyltransferase [bacterium]|nr:phosphatidate cytidylyltransferase [bacterium]
MSNLAIRIAATIVGIPILLTAAMVGGSWLILLIVMIQLAILLEWRKFAHAAGVPLWSPAVGIAVAGLDLFVFGTHSNLMNGESIAAIYFWVLLVVFSRSRKPLLQLGYGALFLVYVALPLSLWFSITQSGNDERFGRIGALGVLFLSTWLCDSAAYFGGRTFGRTKLYPMASPNKTVEGAVSGFLGSSTLLPVMSSVGAAIPNTSDFVAIPIITGIAGQIGDLIESLMKREAGMKDSSRMIPGHGGFLDRFDSLLLSSPLFLAYLYFTTT